MAITKKGIGAMAVAVGLCVSCGWLYIEELDDGHEVLIGDLVAVVKATYTVPENTVLTRDRIRIENVPRNFLPPNPLLESELSTYLGTPLARSVEHGAMILTSDFTRAGLGGALISSLVIKTAAIHLETDSPSEAGKTALDAVTASGGYIVASDTHLTRTSQTFAMTARVPAAKFEAVMAEMDELGAGVERRVRGAGIVGDVQRLERQLGNKDFVIEGLRAAKATSQTVEIVESDLAVAQQQRVEVEDKLAELSAETALATIDLTITQPATAPAERSIVTEVADELAASARAVVRGCLTVVRTVATALPLAFFLSPLLVVVGLWRRRRSPLG